MEVVVKAKDNSTGGGTGEIVGAYNSGDLIIITCDPQDTWSLAGQVVSGNCNTMGVVDHPYKPRNQSFNLGSLVGSIDDGMTYFPIGPLLQMTINENNTTLKLYCWDTNKNDNSGGISAMVTEFRLNS
ncbi:MAG: hypothetical protein COA38_02745 [Fluviicola sp.]|nr:MAG: hypothetical protein COA38_02745 [Fluviicola sp.]